jgi:hypothetical protein
MLHIGRIEVLPPTSKKFVAECSIEILDEQGELIVIIRDICIGKSEWGEREWFASLPAIFHKKYGPDGRTETAIHRPVEFPIPYWKQIAGLVIAEFLKQRECEGQQ